MACNVHVSGGMRREITERAYRFALRLAMLRDDWPYREMIEREVLRQVFRTGRSIGANLEEATGAQTKPDFIAKVSVAKKEAFELQFWLRLACDAGVLKADVGQVLLQEAGEIGRVVSTIVRRAKQSDARNPPNHTP